MVDRSEFAHVRCDVLLYSLFKTICNGQLSDTFSLQFFFRQSMSKLKYQKRKLLANCGKLRTEYFAGGGLGVPGYVVPAPPGWGYVVPAPLG